MNTLDSNGNPINTNNTYVTNAVSSIATGTSGTIYLPVPQTSSNLTIQVLPQNCPPPPPVDHTGLYGFMFVFLVLAYILSMILFMGTSRIKNFIERMKPYSEGFKRLSYLIALIALWGCYYSLFTPKETVDYFFIGLMSLFFVLSTMILLLLTTMVIAWLYAGFAHIKWEQAMSKLLGWL